MLRLGRPVKHRIVQIMQNTHTVPLQCEYLIHNAVIHRRAIVAWALVSWPDEETTVEPLVLTDDGLMLAQDLDGYRRILR